MEQKPSSTEKQPSRAAFERFLQFIDHIWKLTHLCVDGLHKTTKAPELVKALAELQCAQEGREWSDVDKHSVERAEEQATFAKAEADAGFPTLHAHAVVSLWGALEVLCEDLFIARLKEDPKLLKDEQFQKLKVPLVEFHQMDEEDRLGAIYSQIERDTRAGDGVTRLEQLFKYVGLEGSVDSKTRKAIFELQQVRNLIVHKAGIADPKFVKACPWLNIAKGQKIRVTHKSFGDYGDAVQTYVINLMERNLLATDGPEALERFRKKRAERKEAGATGRANHALERPAKRKEAA